MSTQNSNIRPPSNLKIWTKKTSLDNNTSSEKAGTPNHIEKIDMGQESKPLTVNIKETTVIPDTYTPPECSSEFLESSQDTEHELRLRLYNTEIALATIRIELDNERRKNSSLERLYKRMGAQLYGADGKLNGALGKCKDDF